MQALQALLAVPPLVLQWRLPPLLLAVQARLLCTLPLLLVLLPLRQLRHQLRLQQVRLQGLQPFLQPRLVLLPLLLQLLRLQWLQAQAQASYPQARHR